jgi:hypothetical protein
LAGLPDLLLIGRFGQEFGELLERLDDGPGRGQVTRLDPFPGVLEKRAGMADLAETDHPGRSLDRVGVSHQVGDRIRSQLLAGQ